MLKLRSLLLSLLLTFGLNGYAQNTLPVDTTGNWGNPVVISRYVEAIYPELKDDILWIIKKESSFNPVAHSGNSYGLMGMTRAAAIDAGFNWEEVKTKPWINIRAGVEYYKQFCLSKAKGDRHQAYKYYRFGPYYDQNKSRGSR